MIQSSPYAFLTLVAAMVSMWLAFAIWSRRPGSGVVSFVVMTLGLTVWTLGSAGELLFTSFQAKSVFVSLAYVGITIVPAAWLLFVLEYTGNTRWITRRTIILLAIEPILVQALIQTNDFHNLFWISRMLMLDSGYIVMKSVLGTAFWVHAIYSYMLLFVSAFLLIGAMVRAPQLYRGQMRLLLLAVFTPWIANAVYLLGLSPLPDFVDLTPIAFVVTAAAVAWSMYRFHLMDIIPVARGAIIDNMRDGLLVLDQNNRIVDANRVALQLLNRTAPAVIGKQAAEAFAHQAELVDRFGDVAQVETEITLPRDGEIHAFNLRISPLYNRKQDLAGRIIVLHDVTNLKRTNRELNIAREKAEEATRLKSHFLATMSHELRTPLNAIIGYTELQLAGMVGDLSDTQYEYNERILANSRHLLGLINDILDLSKIEAGRMELINKPFTVQQWVEEIVQQNAVLAQEKNITFDSQIDTRLPATLVGDAARLRQIVINLLSNAIKFTNDGSVELNILPGDQPKTWMIVVKDTGIGIPPHKQETIFHEFHQVNSSSNREYGGTGLGLAIVRKLTLTMGGSVRVSSTLGQGSTFTITLPLIEETVSNSVA